MVRAEVDDIIDTAMIPMEQIRQHVPLRQNDHISGPNDRESVEFEEEMERTLKSLGQVFRRRSTVTRVNIHGVSSTEALQTIDLPGIPSLLLIESIGKDWIEKLCTELPELTSFVACHLIHVDGFGKRLGAGQEEHVKIMCRCKYRMFGHWDAPYDTKRIFKLTDISEEVTSDHQGTTRLSIIAVKGLCKYQIRILLLLFFTLILIIYAYHDRRCTPR
jgi:hypothetical protein